MGTRRLFFAIWLPERVAAALCSHARALVGAGPGRIMRPETLHLTLDFLGDVEEARVPALLELAEGVAARHAPFDLAFDRLGHWRHNGICWAGCGVPPVTLIDLVRDLRSDLGRQGFMVERRPFVPHVTLARRCTGPLATDKVIESISARGEAIRLVESRLGRAEAAYRSVGAWMLGPAIAPR